MTPPTPPQPKIPAGLTLASNSDGDASAFRSAFAAEIRKGPKAALADSLSDQITAPAFERFRKALTQGGMGAASIPEILAMLEHMACTSLKNKSACHLANPNHVTLAGVKEYVFRTGGRKAAITGKTSVTAADEDDLRPGRPRSANGFLRPAEADDIAGRQSDYDYVFSTFGAKFATAMIQTMRVLQCIQPNTSIHEVRLGMVSAWYADPQRSALLWPCWLILTGFNYPAILNWFPTVQAPVISDDLASVDAANAVCKKLAAQTGWKPGTEARCKNAITSILALTTRSDELRRIRSRHAHAKGDVAVCDAAAHAMLKDFAVRSPEFRVGIDVFDFARQHRPLPLASWLADSHDNMDNLMAADSVGRLLSYLLGVKINTDEALTANFEQAF